MISDRASPLVVRSSGGSIVDIFTKTRLLVRMINAEQDRVVRREQDVLGLKALLILRMIEELFVERNGAAGREHDVAGLGPI